MLFNKITALAVFAASLVSAAPCSSVQTNTQTVLSIPTGCTTACSTVAQAYSACTNTTVGCTALCSTEGLNAYITCSNCVLNGTVSVSQVSYTSIAAELSEIKSVCSSANISANATSSLVAWSFLSNKTGSSNAGGINNVVASGATINSVSIASLSMLVASAIYVLV